MTRFTVVTYDWVPEPPRGFVRDIRIRWALEEAGMPYSVKTTPFRERGAEHLAHQPFAQVPWLTDADISIFESGAILLHLGGLSEALMPADPKGRAEVTNWLFAALNSVEMATQPWSFMFFADGARTGVAWDWLDGFYKIRLDRLEPVLADREWLAGDFSIADILMADVLRLPDRFGGLEAYPACKAYMDRAVARPAFKKAYADQMAHFSAAD